MKPSSVLVATLVTALSSNHALAACQSTAGEWSDNYGLYWQLQQQSNGQVSGYVIHPQCFYYPVSGQMNGDGSMTLDSGESPAGGECVPFVYSGTILKPGCHTGTGIWYNIGAPGYGSWFWSKACDIPTGEENTPVTWNGDNPTAFNWRGTALPTTTNYGGRTLTEDVATFNECKLKFNGDSELDRFSISANLNSDNSYIDVVGFTTIQVNFYRQVGVTPCIATSNQTITIDCAANQPFYFFNQLGAEITPTTVSSSRAGQTRTRSY